MSVSPRFLALLLGAIAMQAPPAAISQAWHPGKPVRLVVSFPPGGGAELAARTLAQPLSVALGQPVVVETKPGADGQIAATEVKHAPPDGHTLYLGSASSFSYVPAIRRTPPYDPVADFTPISSFFRVSSFLFVHSSVSARSLTELFELARANPDTLAYGSGNAFAIVGMAQLLQQTGTRMVHVPYKGEAPAMVDLAAGRIHVMLTGPAAVLGHLKEGRVRALALALPHRSLLLPDVPTFGEAGFAGPRIEAWGGIFGPRDLPRAVVAALSREIALVLDREEISAQLAKLGFAGRGSTPEELADYVRTQLVAWREGIRSAGLQQQ